MDFLFALIGIIGYTLIMFYCIIFNSQKGAVYTPLHFLMAAAIIFLLLLYMSIAYKLIFISILFMAIGMMFIFTCSFNSHLVAILGNNSLNTIGCCIIGYLIVFLGIFISALLRRAVYKLPLSKWAAGNALRKQL